MTNEFENVNSEPTLPALEIKSIRMSDLESELENARRQGYTESDIRLKVLEIVQQVVAMIPGM